MYRGGRGRGRGGFGSTQRSCKEEPFILFPEIKEFPAVNPQEIDEQLRKLVSWGNDLHKFWTSSSYHLDDARQGAEKNGGLKRRPLSDFMMMTDDYVPAELDKSSGFIAKNARRNNKKVRWDPQSDLQRLDLFEKLDQIKGQDDDDNEKKEDEDEDGEEDDENVEEEEPEDGYTENIGFDDDEDENNPEDDGGGDEEGYY